MKLILDLDTGIDDALALAFAISAHERGEAELLAVTGTYGNVYVEQGVANARALLELLGHPEIPVIPGPQKPGFEVLEISSFIHGSNGVGNVALPAAPAQTITTDAVDFLIEAYRTHGADLTIIPTGPSTTIAAAMRQAPELADAPVVFMGGALTVPGNVTPLAEANVIQDPTATDFLLRYGTNVSMVGLDVTTRTVLTKKHTAQWRGTRVGDIYADMFDYYIDAYAQSEPELGGCGLHDPLAVATALDPSLIDWLPINMMCTTEGRTTGDPARFHTEVTSRAAVGVNIDRFVDDLMARMAELFGKSSAEL